MYLFTCLLNSPKANYKAKRIKLRIYLNAYLIAERPIVKQRAKQNTQTQTKQGKVYHLDSNHSIAFTPTNIYIYCLSICGSTALRWTLAAFSVS
jgi:hypothetical protein